MDQKELKNKENWHTERIRTRKSYKNEKIFETKPNV